MAGPAAGSDAGCHWRHAPQRGFVSQLVQIGRARGPERSDAALLACGNVAQAVEHHEGELGRGFEGQFRVKRIEVHVQSSVWHRVNRIESRQRHRFGRGGDIASKGLAASTGYSDIPRPRLSVDKLLLPALVLDHSLTRTRRSSYARGATARCIPEFDRPSKQI